MSWQRRETCWKAANDWMGKEDKILRMSSTSITRGDLFPRSEVPFELVLAGFRSLSCLQQPRSPQKQEKWILASSSMPSLTEQ
jgi:hypothetical protein